MKQTTCWFASLLCWIAATIPALASDLAKGEAVFKEQCASCHGLDGQGTRDKYNEPLAGDLSITELAKVIDETMPEGEPEKSTPEDSAAVAAFIHQAFYSEVARERLRPARIELARLTVNQYRNAIADLFPSGNAVQVFSAAHGLRGEYYDSRNFKRDKRIIDRVDAQVNFDFGGGRPDDENFLDGKFAIRWDGSVIAPETGNYDFCIDTENAFRLYVNNDRTPLIDAWVRSGSDRQFRGSLFLIGGRAYPLKLEYQSAELTSSIALKWKTPKDIEQLIPARNLRAARAGEIMVVDTKFPPDDSSAGYARGILISKEWDQATTDAALNVADMVATRLDNLAGTKADDAERPAKVKKFCDRLVSSAWARPLADDERAAVIDRFFTEGTALEAAVKRVVLVALKSPSFLYREVGQARQQDLRTATRLSFALWDSLPDRNLHEAAVRGELKTPEHVRAHAQRMLDDPRTQAKVREFMLHWMKLDTDVELSKDNQLVPEFTPSVISDLRASLELFVDEVVWSERSDFRELLRADYLILNRPLAEVYAPEFAKSQGDRLGNEFVKVPCGADRSGILTHPYLMSTFAYHASSSPIHRGVFLARNVLGRAIKAPPEAITPIAPELHAGLSTRERVHLQTSPAFCQSCHSMINSLGFGLENYDLIGRYRLEEKSKPVESTGTYRDRLGKLVNFNGSRELATFLVDSPEVQTAFVMQLFQHLAKQPPAAFGPEVLPQLRQRFVENEFSVRKLIIDIVSVSALRGVELQNEG